MSKNFSYKINKRGFTLLEMIVSLGVFSIIAVIAVGALVRITSLNRQAQSLQSAVNNINYILESISREMRLGSAFRCTNTMSFSGRDLIAAACPNDISGDDKAILFKSTRTSSSAGVTCPLINAYWFVKTGSYWDIKKSQQNTCDEAISKDTALSLIDSRNVSINKVNIKVFSGNLGYSRAFLGFGGFSGVKVNEQNDFDIWTQVSQRSTN